jgi:hypothetical protein
VQGQLYLLSNPPYHSNEYLSAPDRLCIEKCLYYNVAAKTVRAFKINSLYIMHTENENMCYSCTSEVYGHSYIEDLCLEFQFFNAVEQ